MPMFVGLRSVQIVLALCLPISLPITRTLLEVGAWHTEVRRTTGIWQHPIPQWSRWWVSLCTRLSTPAHCSGASVILLLALWWRSQTPVGGWLLWWYGIPCCHSPLIQTSWIHLAMLRLVLMACWGQGLSTFWVIQASWYPMDIVLAARGNVGCMYSTIMTLPWLAGSPLPCTLWMTCPSMPIGRNHPWNACLKDLIRIKYPPPKGGKQPLLAMLVWIAIQQEGNGLQMPDVWLLQMMTMFLPYSLCVEPSYHLKTALNQ